MLLATMHGLTVSPPLKEMLIWMGPNITNMISLASGVKNLGLCGYCFNSMVPMEKNTKHQKNHHSQETKLQKLQAYSVTQI